MLLLDGNPLANIENVRNKSGVMLRGRWFTAAELQVMLAQLAAKYAETK